MGPMTGAERMHCCSERMSVGMVSPKESQTEVYDMRHSRAPAAKADKRTATSAEYKDSALELKSVQPSEPPTGVRRVPISKRVMVCVSNGILGAVPEGRGAPLLKMGR